MNQITNHHDPSLNLHIFHILLAISYALMVNSTLSPNSARHFSRDIAGGPAASEARGGFGSQPLPDPARLGRTWLGFFQKRGISQIYCYFVVSLYHLCVYI